MQNLILLINVLTLKSIGKLIPTFFRRMIFKMARTVNSAPLTNIMAAIPLLLLSKVVPALIHPLKDKCRCL